MALNLFSNMARDLSSLAFDSDFARVLVAAWTIRKPQASKRKQGNYSHAN